MARSCTTTAYRWLCRDAHRSLRTLWSAVIKSPKFSARGTTVPVRFLEGALVILVRKHTSQFRSFGKWVKIRCFLDATFVARSESESWEMLALPYLQDFLWAPLAIQEGLAIGRPHLDCHPSFYSCCVIRTTLVGLVRHFALGLDLLKANLAMSMLTTNCSRNWWITLEQQEVRSSLFCKQVSYPLWSIVVFDRLHTHKNVRGLRRVFQAIEQQAFLRIIALSRIDLDRERTFVLPRLCALLHWL